ncbi:phage holin family protein [Clostridium ganghwense]|uniref:phage holin family protein n=1 Tax=Clostridium ganghwense TaxID=312089 RepID=UPI0023430F20|nr:phage holin family protein [Clostridium ganghwense]
MNNIDLMKYVTEQALILIPVLYVLGIIIKNIPNIPDWVIPWIILMVSIVLSVLILEINVQAVIQGILVAGVTVLSNQLVKQTTKKK